MCNANFGGRKHNFGAAKNISDSHRVTSVPAEQEESPHMVSGGDMDELVNEMLPDVEDWARKKVAWL